MKCAKHNAKIYGVDKKIVWITGDCFNVIQSRFSGRENVLVFGSPPWGGEHKDSKSIWPSTVLTSIGTEYNATDVFDLSTMQPYSLDALYKSFSKVSKDLVFYLPRTSDLNQIAKYASEGNKLEVSHYCIKGASKVSRPFNDV